MRFTCSNGINRALLFAIALCSMLLLAAATQAESASAYQLGTQTNYKTLAMIVRYEDDPPPTVTAADFKNLLFTAPGSVHQWLLANSFGKVGLTGVKNIDGDVTSYITIHSPRAGRCLGRCPWVECRAAGSGSP